MNKTISSESTDTEVSIKQEPLADGELLKKTDNVKKPLICIEAGHQEKANLELEPTAPGSKIMKEKVRGGTQGVQTKKAEYQLNLEVAMMLENALAEDFDVVMVRRTNDVDISNSERAMICNDAEADLMIRLHADGNENSQVKGMTFIYPSPENEYTKPVAEKSKDILEVVAQDIISETGAKSRGIIPRGDLTGFNWLKVPSILIEMGFMTNKEEDVLLSNAEYQRRIVAGIKKGLINYDFINNMNSGQ
ncbi:N-acetylmuramoyl-L-alanine amidase [Paenibacillus amylolyticus]|uniref:N-acetylmuramoyl-L-alanine amidase n=1 Tax=Paenibacillus amylolyticus TaxID=1451 RepID=A0AAP5H5C4_PAEAM|nr:N-acetylmuramoyl-L-alanine amidase [Paenibacillus amylolyticus]